jgi:adenylate cyclase
MKPTELIGMLNDYLAEMSEVIFKYQGMINEFEGDGILAVFGAPLDLPQHAECAVSAGEEMLEVVKKINVEWEASGRLEHWRAVGIDSLAIRIGIHSGAVVAGNIGTEKRMKYAVIGDTVNTAARIEALNKELETSILFSTPTKRLLDAKHRPQSLGAHYVKGKAEPVEVYTVPKIA